MCHPVPLCLCLWFYESYISMSATAFARRRWWAFLDNPCNLLKRFSFSSFFLLRVYASFFELFDFVGSWLLWLSCFLDALSWWKNGFCRLVPPDPPRHTLTSPSPPLLCHGRGALKHMNLDRGAINGLCSRYSRKSGGPRPCTKNWPRAGGDQLFAQGVKVYQEGRVLFMEIQQIFLV